MERSVIPGDELDRLVVQLRTFGHLRRGGHFAAVEAPEEVAAALREFVATLG